MGQEVLVPPYDNKTTATAESPTKDEVALRPDLSGPAVYSTGCPDLDARVLGPLGGGVVGISSDGDVGIVVALQVAARHLQHDAAATARVVTTRPVAQVVSLLKGVLRGTKARGEARDGHSGSSKQDHASLLRRVLISRVYGPDDVDAVLDELEASGPPFQRLWPVSASGGREVADAAAEGTALDTTSFSSSCKSVPRVLILTEMDHHLKWMRLQGGQGGLRLHAQYGRLLRRLRALTVQPADRATAARPVVFVLNSTLVRRPAEEPAVDGRTGGYSYDDAAGAGRNNYGAPPSEDVNCQLALSILQQQQFQPHIRRRAEILRQCCQELARAQHAEPRYKGLINYLCTIHLCFTRLPPDLVDPWAFSPPYAADQRQASNVSDSSLWVATVENDETEISSTTNDRIGVVHFARGALRDALPT